MNKSKKMSLVGKLTILAITVIWGSSFIILKDTLDKLGNGHFTFFVLAFRFLLAAIILTPFVAKKFKLVNKSTLKKSIVLGLTLVFAYVFQTIGLKYTTSSKNAFLTAVYVVMVPFCAWFISKKKPMIKDFISAFLCIIGIAFVALIGRAEHGTNELLGDSLTLICGIFYALQIIFNDKYSSEGDPVLLVTLELYFVGIVFAIISAMFEFPLYYSEFSIGVEAVLKIAYLAAFATAFAQFGQFWGQKYTSPTSASLIMSLEAVFGTIFGVIFGNDQLTVWIIIGFVIIFIAEILSEIDFAEIFNRKDGNNKENPLENQDYKT